MPIYVLRLRDGNCIVVDAPDEEQATQGVSSLTTSEVATIRRLESFSAQFSLTDEGELTAIILDKKTAADLYQHEYPLLRAAHAQAYQDFGASETDSNTHPLLFSSPPILHPNQPHHTHPYIIHYSVHHQLPP